MIMLGPILPVQLLQQSKISPSSVFHIRCTRQISPPSDFRFFRPLKEAMGGKSFRSDEEVQQAVHEWLRSQPKEFFSRDIHALPKGWNACMERSGDYIEERSLCVHFVFNKLGDKKYLMFSFDSPSYYVCMYVCVCVYIYIYVCVCVCQALESTDIEENSPSTAAIITDSRISLDPIKNVNNHIYLIEEIRKRLFKLESSNWTVTFAWVKAHAETNWLITCPKQRCGPKIRCPTTAEYP